MFALSHSFGVNFSQMDRTDKKILAELQLNGRLSITELAEKVGLSISPCHRRVKALEESGSYQRLSGRT